jgi:hypothetical protein
MTSRLVHITCRTLVQQDFGVNKATLIYHHVKTLMRASAAQYPGQAGLSRMSKYFWPYSAGHPEHCRSAVGADYSPVLKKQRQTVSSLAQALAGRAQWASTL